MTDPALVAKKLAFIETCVRSAAVGAQSLFGRGTAFRRTYSSSSSGE
jgi:hypothetical protein